MPRPSRLTLAAVAYAEYCRYRQAPLPSWEGLTTEERLAWTMGVKVAVREAVRVPKPPPKSPHHRWQAS